MVWPHREELGMGDTLCGPKAKGQLLSRQQRDTEEQGRVSWGPCQPVTVPQGRAAGPAGLLEVCGGDCVGLRGTRRPACAREHRPVLRGR